MPCPAQNVKPNHPSGNEEAQKTEPQREATARAPSPGRDKLHNAGTEERAGKVRLVIVSFVTIEKVIPFDVVVLVPVKSGFF